MRRIARRYQPCRYIHNRISALKCAPPRSVIGLSPGGF
jgi:hypothetical protein